MYLKRLEIQGFKSFANKTTLEFEKGMTAVVGPNGSGKSNVADAIRWVLGEQSLKQIRGKKSEDVIFAGSEKKSKLSFAQVTVTFDNGDRRIPLDYSEVSISRSMDRSGESDYMINGNKVRLLDVIDLVLKSNIGTSRHTVIGQGTIDQMILAGPSEVKNLIDEASGIKSYYIRREKTLRRLEQTTQNLIRVGDLLTELEPRLKSLRRQAKRMEERAVIEEELKIYQSEFYSTKFWSLEDSLKEIDAKLEVFSSERAKLEKEIEDHRKGLDKAESSSRDEVQAYQQVQGEIKKLTDKKNKIIEDIALIRGKLEAEKTGGLVDSKTLNMEKQDLERTKASLAAEIEKTKDQLKIAEEQFKKQNGIFAEINSKLTEIQQTMDHPETANFKELADHAEVLGKKFEEFYSTLEQGSDISLLLTSAQEFKNNLYDFRDKTLKAAQNPFLNFEKQRAILNEALAQKDAISAELNNLDLRKSKLGINIEYLEAELSKTEQKLLRVNLDLDKESSTNIDDYFKSLLENEKKLNAEMSGLAAEIAKLEQKTSEYHALEQSKKQKVFEEEKSYRLKQDELSKVKDKQSEIQIEKAKLETQKENVIIETKQALTPEGFAKIKETRLSASGAENLEQKIAKLKHSLELIGGIDELTIKEYQETEQRYNHLSSQVEDLQRGVSSLREVIDELDQYIKKQFDDSFARINEKFENYFRILFNGGRAYLSILRSSKEQKEEEEESEVKEEAVRPEEKVLSKYEKGTDDVIGIDIKATPPGKKLAGIASLSGGERSLTSIALLCALLSCFPSPFVMLDEVDAALDEANTIRFAQILGTLAHNTQFITVTHNRETMRQAHTLYGVTMGDDGVSKILSIKIEQAQAFAK